MECKAKRWEKLQRHWRAKVAVAQRKGERVRGVDRGAGVVRVASEVWRQGFSFGFGQGFYE